MSRKEAAGSHFDAAVDAAQGQQLILQKNARWKEREHLLVRLDVLQRSEGHIVFGGQPAQNILLGLNGLFRAVPPLARQRLCIRR